MVTYVQGRGSDNWHWCTNCSQWPGNIVKKSQTRPQSDLCNQCKAKELEGSCRVNPGATLEQYDKIVELMGLTSGNIPPGAIFHWTAKTDDGIRVVDVWESREVFDRFSREQIGPFSQQGRHH